MVHEFRIRPAQTLRPKIPLRVEKFGDAGGIQVSRRVCHTEKVHATKRGGASPLDHFGTI
jgi:hypothetical protein